MNAITRNSEHEFVEKKSKFIARSFIVSSESEAMSAFEKVSSQFRDATGLGRKRAIQILEFFDKIGFCQRVGEVHLIRAGSTLFANPKV